MRTINQAGLDLIKEFEGCSLKPYLDSAGILTIGYGHTGLDVSKSLKINQQQAEDLLKKDIGWSEKVVNNRIKVLINDNQFSAVVCFVFNVGSSNFFKSNLLKMINRNQLTDAAHEFVRWNKAKGKVIDGLTRRRLAERDLWNKV